MDDKRLPRKDPFGTRYLTEDHDVFSHNAWDDVEFPEGKLEEISEILEQQRSSKAENGEEIISNTDQSWDQFYGRHSTSFFKDRKYLFREFEEIFHEPEDKRQTKALEVGCGVGNTTFPLLETAESLNPNLFVYSCDFSPKAISLVREHEKFNADHCHPFVWDISRSDVEIPVQEGSIDFVLCIYVLSALAPEKHKLAVDNLVRLMKKGGIICIKDYGRHDFTQLRFKKGRYLQDNLYARGDGTLSYFFDANELHDLLVGAGLTKIENFVDKRMIVNRKTKQTMYRRWIQAKYNKKQLLRLSSEVLKYRAYLEKILDSQNVMRHLTKSTRLSDDRILSLIFLYELVFGLGIRVADKEFNRILKGAKKDILYEHEQLAADNIDPDSLTSKQESVNLPRYVRINTLRASVEDVLEQLKQVGFNFVENVTIQKQKAFNETVQSMQKNEFFFDIHVDKLLVFHPQADLHNSDLVKNMTLVLQDKASCLPAFLLELEPDSQVVDACAAPGMKTTHLADLLQNKGKIWALDRDKGRCKMLKERVENSNATNVEVLNQDFLREDTTGEDYAQINYCLVDAPCSGSGMVKRNNFMQEEVDEKRIASLANLQSMLLKHALKMPNLKRLVYSTCSIHEKENEGVVQEALHEFGDRFELVEPNIKWETRGVGDYEFAAKCLRAYPEKTLTNGFFLAIFQAK